MRSKITPHGCGDLSKNHSISRKIDYHTGFDGLISTGKTVSPMPLACGVWVPFVVKLLRFGFCRTNGSPKDVPVPVIGGKSSVLFLCRWPCAILSDMRLSLHGRFVDFPLLSVAASLMPVSEPLTGYPSRVRSTAVGGLPLMDVLAWVRHLLSEWRSETARKSPLLFCCAKRNLNG